MILTEFSEQYINNELPKVQVGDLIQIKQKVDVDSQKKAQSHTGVIIAKNNSGLNTTITVRKVSKGFGMEFIYTLNSPKILSIEILKQAKVRRSKLYYLRKRQGKSARLKSVN